MLQNKFTIISIYYPPEQGAAPSRIANLAMGLRNRDIEVDVITALPNYPTGRIFPNYRRRFAYSEVIDGIPVRRFWLYPSNSAMPVKRIMNMVSFSAILFCAIPQLLRKRPTMIIVNTPPLAAGLSGVILAKLVRALAITNVSDIWPLTALELGAMRKGWLYSFLEKVERYIYRHSDAIVTQSDEIRQHVMESYPEKRTFLYRNLDSVSEFVDQYPAIQQRPTKIVYAGLLGVAQGLYDICRSIDFKQLGMEFHLYGDGNERARIAEYVNSNPECNIFLHEIVPKNQLPKILSQFHATIVPLRSAIRGAFPSKIYMAISASLPVLFCGSGEGALFVREEGIGWVASPGDYLTLSENLVTLGEMDEADYQALRTRIKSLAKHTYELEDQLDRFVEFLNSVK
jgi:glycosyltransferase involved in cell wall biosynthesis